MAAGEGVVWDSQKTAQARCVAGEIRQPVFVLFVHPPAVPGHTGFVWAVGFALIEAACGRGFVLFDEASGHCSDPVIGLLCSCLGPPSARGPFEATDDGTLSAPARVVLCVLGCRVRDTFGPVIWELEVASFMFAFIDAQSFLEQGFAAIFNNLVRSPSAFFRALIY